MHPGPGAARSWVAAHQRRRIHTAVIEIVAERGYHSLKVEEIVRLAGVSSRSFYELFDNKEHCFLATYDAIVRKTHARVLAAQATGPKPRQRLELALAAVAEQIVNGEGAATLALVEAFSAGPAAIAHIGASHEAFEETLAGVLRRDLEAPRTSALVLEGIVAGIERVARSHLLAGHASELPRLARELTLWALCLASPQAHSLERIAPPPIGPRTPGLRPSDLVSPDHRGARARILAAIVALVASDGYSGLAAPRVRAIAHVSRETFTAHFHDLDDCFWTAVAEIVRRTIARASKAGAAGSDWPRGIVLAVHELCILLAEDPVLARMIFVEMFAAGANGVHFREEIVAGITRQFRAAAPASQRPSPLRAEASVGAVWRVVQRHVLSNEAARLPDLSPLLSFLVLAPAVGTETAMHAISGRPG